MIWLMEILKIKMEEHSLIKYYVKKHLILLTGSNIMGINVDFLQWFIKILIKKTSGSSIKNENIPYKTLAEELQTNY